MKFQWLIFVIISLTALTGCLDVARVKSSSDLENSKAAYKKCLEQNPDAPMKCETLKKIYEADLEAYNALKSQGSYGYSTTVITPRR
jgi:hypothetical protein